jgi:hypothetical protein
MMLISASWSKVGLVSPLRCLKRALTSYEVPLPSLFEGKRVLTVGEGDLGYSAALSRANLCRSLTASTWDSKYKLLNSFPNAQRNLNLIYQHEKSKVVHEMDATKLDLGALGGKEFDIVLWNFPHVPGKANNKWNRVLLESFLFASKGVLAPNGKCVITLCPDQSGWHAATQREWLQSWKLTHYAAESGFLVTDVASFDAHRAFSEDLYYPVGHRGSGGRFSAFRGDADIFVLERAVITEGIRKSGLQAPMYSHEIHINAPHVADICWLEAEAKRAVVNISNIDSTSGDRRNIEDGLVWSCQLVDIYVCPRTNLIAHALEVSYCSTEVPLGRLQADSICERVERSLVDRLNEARDRDRGRLDGNINDEDEGEYYSLRAEKVGGRVSQPHFWGVAQAKKSASLGSESHQLSRALQDVGHDGIVRETLAQLSDASLGNNGYAGEGKEDGENDDDGAAEVHLEGIRDLARSLWRRRVGVLIRNIGNEN